MKILITHELFMPDFAGGGEKLVYEMAKHLQEAGHEIKVLTTGDKKITSYEGIPTIRMPINRYLMNFAIFPILNEARWADIIQTSTYNACLPSWICAKILKKPIVCLVMSFWGSKWFKIRGHFKGLVSKYIEKIQVNRSFDKTVFLSDFSRDFSIKEGLKPKSSTIICPGLDLKDYVPLQKEPMVLFSGRFSMQKGVYEFIEVARKLPEVKFVMMGWGEEEEKMRKNLPSNVQILGYRLKDGQKFFEQYGKALIFFFPSEAETFGFVIVEAMACGCVIVSTIPLGYEGKVVEQGNINQMVESIKHILKEPEKYQKLGQKNTILARKYTWQRFTSELVQVYEPILVKRKSMK